MTLVFNGRFRSVCSVRVDHNTVLQAANEALPNNTVFPVPLSALLNDAVMNDAGIRIYIACDISGVAPKYLAVNLQFVSMRNLKPGSVSEEVT